MFYSDLEDLQTTSATPDGQFLTTNAGGLYARESKPKSPPCQPIIGRFLRPWAGRIQSIKIYLEVARYTEFKPAAYDANCNVAEPGRSPHQTYTLGTSLDFTVGGLDDNPNAMVRYLKSAPCTRNAASTNQ